MKRIDAIFLGRKSYELLMGMEKKNPYPTKTTYVFSNTMTNAGERTEIVKGDVTKEVSRIRNQAGKDIWLFGGASLVTTFINANLVDELQLAVHPLLLGGGKPLFQNIRERIPFILSDTISYSSGLVQLFYQRKQL